MQNLTRGGELRLSILAPKGYQMCVADSGQIEARVNGWLWGQDDLMDAFRAADAGQGTDTYCRFATLIYGRPITKEDETERFVGKVCVLGLGFQMGAAKLQMTLAKGALGGPPIFFELDRCKQIIDTYRRANFKIKMGWDICARIIEDMAAGRPGRHGPISWEKGMVWLPNGMSLKYPELRKQVGDKGWDEWTYKSGDMRKKIYGGLLCENIVQALARIIVGKQMLNIRKKHRLGMTTHDEAVALPKTREAEKCFKYMTECMSTPLDWCMTIPLNCEGGWAGNYSK
jgi:DNA polymerase